ncbi:MAG: ABC-2 transporter permease [Oscillospiraceae bacterium]|nr:ABC-2 transporter permease [Oscillospiraceae bacterium]
MNGLLIKDFYMLMKYCRIYLFITVVFIGISLVNENNTFFMYYPCLLASILPVSLYAFDEKEKWCNYCGTLPVSKSQYVFAKYIFGLIIVVIAALLVTVAQALKMEPIRFNDCISIAAELLLVGLLPPSVILPFIFIFGAEKGRIAYFVAIALVVAATMGTEQISLPEGGIFSLPFALLLAFVLYLFSGLLSSFFYQKREV